MQLQITGECIVCRDLHGITHRGNLGIKNRGNGERVLTFTAVGAVMGTSVWNGGNRDDFLVSMQFSNSVY